MDSYATQLNNIYSEVDAITKALRPDFYEIIPFIMTNSYEITKLADKTTKFSKALTEIADIYDSREKIIVNKANLDAYSIDVNNDGPGKITSDFHEGETRIGLPEDEHFIRVTDENGDVSYGGNQNWFNDTDGNNTKGFGCGIVASVNYALYLNGVREISKQEFMDQCMDFYKRGLFRKTAVREWGGAYPPQMEDFILQKLVEKHNFFKIPHWDYTGSYESDYKYMKKELEEGRPVIWAVHDSEGEELQFYRYDKNKNSYQKSSTATSHYIVVTGIYESVDESGKNIRYVEVSNCGSKEYVNWDEYLAFVDAKSKAGKIENRVGSSVMKLN